MEGIKDTVLNVIKTLDAKRGGEAGPGPEDVLKKVLTKKELGHIKINYFKKGVVYVNVDSSSWLYQMNLHKEALLSRVKKDSSAVKDIRFSIGDIK